MQIGMITNSLTDAGVKDITKIADWAAENGIAALEVGPSIPIDEAKFGAVLDAGRVSFSAFIFCRNFLSEKTGEAETFKKALLERIRLAKKFGMERVICSTGISGASFSTDNPAKFNPEASLEPVAELFKTFAEEAEKYGVKLCYENCPLMGNIAISPYMWDLLFDRIGSDHVGLVFDPSHLVWQMIDPYDAILTYRDRIFHVHGKDCEVDYASLKRVGILQQFSTEKTAFNNPHGNDKNLWWRYRLPGLGDLDWAKIVSRLYEIGYSGCISIEHEDPVWSGSEEKVKAGIVRAGKHLAKFI
jgi:sugar phosphate isomerase/epimerase